MFELSIVEVAMSVSLPYPPQAIYRPFQRAQHQVGLRRSRLEIDYSKRNGDKDGTGCERAIGGGARGEDAGEKEKARRT